MDTVDRRSFVKKSLATSMTFTFSGLIRAHGEEGGETTVPNPGETTFETTFDTTPSNPEETTFDATYDTTDSGGTTTWNPDDSTFESTPSPEYTTTWDPEETTVVTTETSTAPITYRLESSPTGVHKQDGTWDTYKEQWIPDNLNTPSGETYAAKAKFWVNPADGKSRSDLTIEYCAELFPNGVAAANAAPTQTTDKLTFKGVLPDPSAPSMTASLEPAAKIAAVPIKTAIEPNPITGSVSGDKPAKLATSVFSEVTSKAPTGADTYSVFTMFTLEMSSTQDFSTLPTKATVQFDMRAISYHKIIWFDTSGTPVGTPLEKRFNGIGQIVTMEIGVAPDI